VTPIQKSPKPDPGDGTKPVRADDRYRQLFLEDLNGIAVHEMIFDAAGRPADYRFLEVNPAFEQLTGLVGAEIVGRTALEVLPDLERSWIERYGRVALTGEPEQFESYNAPLKRHFMVRAYRPAEGQFVAVFHDVTLIHERRAFAETIVSSAGEGTIVYDRDLRFLVWNPVMEELTGLAADQVIGTNAYEVFPEIMAAGVGEDLARALAGEAPTSRQFEYMVPRTGRRGWVVQTNRPHRSYTGELIGVVSSVRDITAQHEADEALRQSEEQFRAIFDSVGDAVAIHRPGGKFLEVNRVLCERLGYTREEMLAMRVDEINTPESVEHIAERIAQIFEAGSLVFETTHLRRDGTVIPVEVSARLIQFRGQPAVLGVHRDLTARLRAEMEIHEQARFLQQLIDAIPIPIIAKDGEGRAQVCNEAFAAAGGRLGSEIIGKTVAELGIPEPAVHTARDKSVLTDGKPQVYEAFMPVPGHPKRRFFMSKAPLRAADGAITGVVTAAVDIGDRYEAEQALRQSEERFRTLFENAGDAILIVGAEGLFVEANRTACERLGYSREELLEMTPEDLETPEFRVLFEDRKEILQTQGSLSFETAQVTRSGAVIPTEIIATVIELGGRIAILAIAHDLTEHRRAEAERAALEAQLRQAQKMEGIGQLAGGIAHDFNNLLTAIRGNASLALAEVPPDSRAREDLEQIEQASDRAAALTRQLLAFARRTVLQPEVVDLGVIVRRLEPMLRRLLGEDVSLVTVTPPSRGAIMADPSQIEQVIVNLAVNARDAMPDGGTLTIETADVELDEATVRAHPSATPGPNAMIAVTDTGTGMAATTLDRLFEPFFTTKGPGKGTGLGLATVYGIVRQSGGAIWANSELGKGSTLTVHLPWVEGAVQVRPGAPPVAVVDVGGPRTGTVLVVEDDDGVRGFATRVLERAGYRVLSASGGAYALANYGSESIDLLVTDVVMPSMNGREVADRLLARHRNLRVMFMSGHADTTIVKHGVLDPKIRYLPKPFTAQALLAAVADALAAPLPAEATESATRS
jgi:two-component system, cell cycle sensor histidine kinase and response regulator CckA